MDQSLKVVVSERSIVPLCFHATVFEFLFKPAWTQVVPAEFFCQLLVAMNDSCAALDMRLGRETLPAFAHWFKNETGLFYAWYCSDIYA